MNRYVLVPIVYQVPYQTVLQVLDTEESMPVTPPDGVSAMWVDATGNTTVQVGWKAQFSFDAGWVFTELTYEENLSMAAAYMRLRFDSAARWLMFNPLQYKVDLGLATASDEALLMAYKQYCVTVSEVINQPGYPSTIIWPVAPF